MTVATEARRSIKRRTMAVIAVDRADIFAEQAQRNLKESEAAGVDLPRLAWLRGQADTSAIAAVNARLVAFNQSLIERSQTGPEFLNCEPFESLRQLAARPSLRLRALHKRLGLPDPAKENHPAATGRR